MKLRGLPLTIVFLFPAAASAQRPMKQSIYAGGMGGVATLSGDGSAVVTPTSASASLFDPQNGGAAAGFAGIHFFEYISFQADYVWNRNSTVLVSTSGEANSSSFFRVRESVTQDAFLANVLVYFRKRESRVRPYLSEGGGAVLLHNRLLRGPAVKGSPVLPPAVSHHTSIALRTLVGIDLRLRSPWYFRYSFGETITRNTLGDQVTPPQHRIPKNFQNLFGLYYRF